MLSRLRSMVKGVSENQPWRRRLPWVGLACILVAYVIAIVRLHPTRFFGYTQDDTIYFSSAKALAEGKGYILPSIPGTPAATKYPILFPWILSWIWRWNASFPANLVEAIALTVVCGLAFLALIFVFLRSLDGINDGEALVITAFCALHPTVVFYAANIVTDIPFAALALGVLVVADRTMRRDSRAGLAVLCGILAAFAMQLRSIGVAVVAGIALYAILRRAWHQLAGFCLAAGACLLPAILRQIHLRATQHAVSNVGANFGWNKVFVYYTSYLGYWRMGVPNAHVLLNMLGTTAIWLLRAPADYFLRPKLAQSGLFVLLLVDGLVLAGILRQAQRNGWRPIHCALPFFMGIALLWNLSDDYRFFIALLPLFAAGYWLETKRILALARRSWSRRRKPVEMVLAGALVTAIALGNMAIGWNIIYAGHEQLASIAKKHWVLVTDRREAYDWISRRTAPDSRVIAYQDAELFLYTGREETRPIVFTTVEAFDPERMHFALDHMTDVAQAVGAGYWLDADDDYNAESPSIARLAIRRQGEIERNLPLVFRSADGRVRIYRLGQTEEPAEKARRNLSSQPRAARTTSCAIRRAFSQAPMEGSGFTPWG